MRIALIIPIEHHKGNTPTSLINFRLSCTSQPNNYTVTTPLWK